MFVSDAQLMDGQMNSDVSGDLRDSVVDIVCIHIFIPSFRRQ